MTVHPTAIVESKQVGAGTCVWAYAHVMKDVAIGCNVTIGDHCFVESGASIGNNVTIKNQVLIWEGIVVEDDVFLGPRVTFTNDRHPRSPRMERAKQRYADRNHWLCQTKVRRGSSIGAAATICPGIEVGMFSMVGAGALVTKDVAPFALVVGVPAQHVDDVCGCGQPLKGPFTATTCQACGESPAIRKELLAANREQDPVTCR